MSQIGLIAAVDVSLRSPIFRYPARVRSGVSDHLAVSTLARGVMGDHDFS